MRKRNSLITLLSLLGVVAVLFAGVGCVQPTEIGNPVPPDPFTVVWGPGEDRVVAFSGDSAGNTAGEVSEFSLKLDNNSSEPWQGEYIIELLDKDSIVMEIARDTFSVPAGLESQIDIQADFDDSLEGPYGLSLYLPSLEAQSVQTIWIGEKSAVEAGPWPSRATHPWLWPEDAAMTEEKAREKAEEFVMDSPTFLFDGIEESLELVETLYPDMENAWQFVYHFDSRHAGYGDRTNQMLAQVITPHEAVIIVEKGEIKSAVMDGVYDMVNQRMIEEEVEIELAPIHEVEVVFMESFPVQVGVYIKGGLSDGCTSFRDAVVRRDGNTVNIEVTTERPKDEMCPAVYTYFEENLNLGSEFTPGTVYTLNVNDYTIDFEMP